MLFKGLIPAMVTPFLDNDFGIDESRTKKLVDYLIDRGATGLFILGTNGEAYMMKQEEKLNFAKIVIEHTNSRVPVYVGTGGNSTLETIELSKEMEKLGADALSIVTPYFAKLNEREIYDHYVTIAENIKIPIILYNIPKRTGNALEPELVSKLAKLDNIKGIKDSSGDLNNLEKYIDLTKNEDFSVLSGSDGNMIKAFELGASGAVSGTSNVITKLNKNIYKEFSSGNLSRAQDLHDKIQLFRKVNHSSTEPSVIKAALNHIGVDVGKPREPILPPDSNVILEIEEMMEKYTSFESSLD